MALFFENSRNFQGEWRKTPGRLIGLTCIVFYQKMFSSFVGNHCRHFPTCSEYAYEAIARHGLWVGICMMCFRIVRCGPWKTWDIDLVPETVSFLEVFRNLWSFVFKVLGYKKSVFSLPVQKGRIHDSSNNLDQSP